MLSFTPRAAPTASPVATPAIRNDLYLYYSALSLGVGSSWPEHFTIEMQHFLLWRGKADKKGTKALFYNNGIPKAF